ncbi:MAG: hypothetical protein BWY31_03571 [Lentisphaerae bacterium ADurb.Bin242]|nr:MAG: hypothetical protein BWY31_03571 [Lentisphaerae bacterium ADurb.Bin242]
MWSKKGGAPFKIGAPVSQWKNPTLKENLKNVDCTHLAVPGGLWIYNNTIVEPDGSLIMELNWSHQRIDNIYFYNNLIVAGTLRQYQDQWEKGGSSRYEYVNNRIWWQHTVPLVPSLKPQSLSDSGEVLPGFRKGNFRPAAWSPSAEVPGSPEKFPYVGAYQRGDEEIAPFQVKQENRKGE